MSLIPYQPQEGREVVLYVIAHHSNHVLKLTFQLHAVVTTTLLSSAIRSPIDSKSVLSQSARPAISP